LRSARLQIYEGRSCPKSHNMTKDSFFFIFRRGKFPFQSDAFRGHGLSLLDEKEKDCSCIATQSFVANELCKFFLHNSLPAGSSPHALDASLSEQKNICYSHWKEIGRTFIRPISLRRVTAGAHVFSPSSTPIKHTLDKCKTDNYNCLQSLNVGAVKRLIFINWLAFEGQTSN